MPKINKTVTESSITLKYKSSSASDIFSLPKSFKITEGPIKSSERSRRLQS